MTAVAEVTREQPLAPVSQSTALISMIERAAMNPNVDIDKMERLLRMQEQVLARQAEIEFNTELSQMQASMPCVGERGTIKDKHGRDQSSYALWEDVLREILPVLAQHGFSLSFRVQSSLESVSVTGVLAHRSGHKTETSLVLPIDGSGSKNGVQAVASSISYGQRYTARALLNFATHNDPHDDDGQGAGPQVDTLNADQVAQIRRLLKEAGGDEKQLLEYLKQPSFELAPVTLYETILALIARKKSIAQKGRS